ncbi:MAG: helix-turn-helix transcriptional regulator [Desulfobacterales bacterium]|nr:helix-turn-helix transcriptional regulator [Desulfobacterales bacterium]
MSLSHLYAWNGQTLFFGYLPNIEEHSHHALQIEIGLYKSFEIYHGDGKLVCRLALIPPDVPHHINDCNDMQAIIYLEPESIVGQRLRGKFLKIGEIEELDFNIIKPLIEHLQTFNEIVHDCHEANSLVRAILRRLSGEDLPDCQFDGRIKRVIDICKKAPGKKISTKELAEKVSLSEGRLIHLFKDQVGVPIRRYLLWARLSDALMELSKGGSFTEAAHHAGFSDSSHLSRTYRKMYGNSLYDLVRSSQFVQAIPCSV